MHLEIVCVATAGMGIQTSWALPSSWTIEASSSWDGSYGPDNVKEHSGRPWHSREDFPQHLIFDAGEVVAVDALATSQPPSGWSGSAMRGYTLFRSDNGEDWSEVTAGEGRNLAGGQRQEIEFPVASARYWKLQIDGNHGYHRLVTTQYVEFRIGEQAQPSCCLALDASCLACQAQVTIEEFCIRSPLTQGCPETPVPDPNPDAVTAVAGPLVHVLIDNSNENTKCVTAPVPVICADDAGHFGNRLNTHTAGDEFEIRVNGAEVCATRTDSPAGWGMHLEIACAAAPVHILIDRSSENTKCVRHSFPVSCAGDAGNLHNRINSHQAGDTFDITTSVDVIGPKICATRTDSGAGWGMRLEIACVAASGEELQGQIVATPAINILIDNSNENIKCVEASLPVICAGDAGQLGNRINSHNAGDTFEITTDGTQVCARRTDSPNGWGMHLEITCMAAPVRVLIDSSRENTKCVTASYPVTCADDAGHLGSRVNSHQADDTFEITSNGVEVCATRTDAPVGWGMHLEIVCVATAGMGIQTSWALPSSWTIEASSSWDGSYGPDNVKEHSGRPWHSREDFPQHLIFDAGEVVAVDALATSQPPSGWSGSAMRGYTLFRSDNGEDWSEVTAGEGRNLAGGQRQEIEFPVASARYWKLQIDGNHGYHRLVTTQYVEFRIGEQAQPSCCLALDASCLACQAQVTIEEFCIRSPLTQGCPIMPDVDQGDLATLHWDGGSFTIPAGQEGICLVRGPETFPNDLVDRVSGLRDGCEVDLYQHGCPGGRVGTTTGLTSDQGGLLGLEITALSVTCHPVDPPVGLATVHWNGGFFTIPDEEEGICLSRGSATFPNDQVASITDMRDGCTVDFYQHGCPGGRVGTTTHVTEPRSDLFDLEITALKITCQGNPINSPVTHPVLQNGDFEAGFSTSNYEYTHAVTGWTAAGGTVSVHTNNAPWGGVAARSGHYLLALQSRGASVKQMVSGHMVGHEYKLVFGDAQRTNSPGGRNAILRVTANGSEMMSEVVLSLSMERREYTYTADAAEVEIKFENVVAEGDQTIFIDGVELSEA